MPLDITLTLDHGVLVNYEDRLCDASYIDEIFQKAAQRGIRTILWRTLGGPRGLYRSRSVPSFEDQSPKWKPLLAAVDPLEAAVNSAKKHGLQLLAWATLQDFHIVRSHINVTNTTPFFDQHPHLYWLSVDGKHHHPGLPCYAYEQARQYYMNHIKEVLDYGVSGIFVCFRSHAGEPEEDDQFGYNEPWLQKLRDQTGVNASPSQIRNNAWLAYRMQKIRGDSYTLLLQLVREAAGTRPVWAGVSEEPDILLAGHSEKENPQRSLHRARMDISRWCREGLVDAVVAVASRINPCDPSIAEIHRDTTARFDKPLYTWLNMISQFPNCDGKIEKRTPRPDELRTIVARARECQIDGLALHEVADLEFSYTRIYVDGKKGTIINPHPDREAQWDAIMG